MTDKTANTTRTVGDSKRESDGDNCLKSGLDAMGQMRIADRITISARGGSLLLTQSSTGREVEVAEETFAGIVEEEYFIDHKD
jgi:hypothetical protein